MKTAIFTFLTLLISVMSYAGECPTQGAYVGGLAGANFLSIKSDHHQGFHDAKTKTGFNVGGFVGYKFSDWENPNLNIRLEGEVSYRRNSLKSFKNETQKVKLHGYTSSMTYMANAYYDFETNTKWTPYVGAGIGYIQTKNHVSKLNGERIKDSTGKNVKVKGKSDGFASQYMAGIAYRVDEGMDVGVEYRYLLARKHAHEQTAALVVKKYF